MNMPIKPENRARYPKDWKQIRERILERAGNACEGSPAFPDCRIPNGTMRVNGGGEHNVTRIVLTIGHLDHTPENCDATNLRAWCQRCHLNYDAKHHAQSAYKTRREGKAVSDFFTVAA